MSIDLSATRLGQVRHELGHPIVELPAQPLPFLHHGVHGQEVLLAGRCLSLESPEDSE